MKVYLLVSCYNLRAEKHFVHNVFGRGRESYSVSSVGEILNQTLMVFKMVGRWKTMGKKSKLESRAKLHHGLGNDIDKSCHVIRSQLETFKLR